MINYFHFWLGLIICWCWSPIFDQVWCENFCYTLPTISFFFIPFFFICYSPGYFRLKCVIHGFKKFLISFSMTVFVSKLINILFCYTIWHVVSSVHVYPSSISQTLKPFILFLFFEDCWIFSDWYSFLNNFACSKGKEENLKLYVILNHRDRKKKQDINSYACELLLTINLSPLSTIKDKIYWDEFKKKIYIYIILIFRIV